MVPAQGIKYEKKISAEKTKMTTHSASSIHTKCKRTHVSNILEKFLRKQRFPEVLHKPLQHRPQQKKKKEKKEMKKNGVEK